MKDFEEELKDRLRALRGASRLRALELPAGRDFASNDYLGLARDPAFAARLRDRLGAALEAAEPLAGAPASRLLRGHTQLHAELEASLAAFKGTEAALLLPSGYQANVGLIQALAGPGDRILSDALNHASLIDGMRLSKAEVFVVPHLDVNAVGRRLAEDWPGRTFLVTESLFSMDGDLAPLDRYAELCERHGAELIVDDAHATGLFGERGSGWVEGLGLERRVLATTSTFGKAFGAAGAFIAGSKTLIRYLVNTCRSFVYSTAVSPLVCHAAAVGLEVIRGEPERRA
ncbi:MAG: aminotransferase class I/II-fold pyridoxal phosphate-dependent enzyme, partial [Acidobacteriota bacterium]